MPEIIPAITDKAKSNIMSAKSKQKIIGNNIIIIKAKILGQPAAD
jgi:hypothetical protein